MKSVWTLELEPVDTLFFRDARPMQAGAGSGGQGTNWPLPTVVHEALRAALLRHGGLLPNSRRVRGHNGKLIASRDFESLRTIGPFPVREREVYFPTPADLLPDGENDVAVLSPVRSVGSANYPLVWLYPVAGFAPAGKQTLPDWIGRPDLEQALRGVRKLKRPAQETLWDVEHRIGIGIDPATRAVAEGAIYSAEHLRLRQGFCLGVRVGLSTTAPPSELTVMEALVGAYLPLGGESRLCRVRNGEPMTWPDASPHGSIRIKWVLATPAVFRGGWRPNWVETEEGRVMLKRENPQRLPGEHRKAWRTRVRDLPTIDARLVAVCSKKPRAFSGWEITRETDGKGVGAPKASRLAVPAGSVYYFEAAAPEDADALVTELHGRTRSDFFGEKGMGLGFCGTWEWLDLESSGPPALEQDEYYKKEREL